MVRLSLQATIAVVLGIVVAVAWAVSIELPGESLQPKTWLVLFGAGAAASGTFWLAARPILWIAELRNKEEDGAAASPGFDLGTERLARVAAIVVPFVMLYVRSADADPWILLGALLLNLSTGHSLLTASAMGLGNTLEALVGASLIQRFCSAPAFLERVRDAFYFVVLVVPVCTALSALTGAGLLVLDGTVPGAEYGQHLLTWWVGDALGALVVAPLLLATGFPKSNKFS